MKCPCMGCDRRKLGCHGRCDDYQQWKKEREEVARKKELERQKNDCHSSAFKKMFMRGL